MLELKNVFVKFGNISVLQNLSCVIEKGDFITIVGANGSGKTTLFDVLSGKVKPNSGTIILNGKNITNFNEIKRSSFIGRLFQNTYMSSVASMTVEENLVMATFKNKRLGLTSGIKKFPKELVEQALKLLNIEFDVLMKKKIGSLSGGQRQIVSFIMSTIVPPEILLLDEPTAALDPVAATQLLVFVNEFISNHKITTLLITHDPNIALRLGDKLWILENKTVNRLFGMEKKSLSPDCLIGQIDYEKLG